MILSIEEVIRLINNENSGVDGNEYAAKYIIDATIDNIINMRMDDVEFGGKIFWEIFDAQESYIIIEGSLHNQDAVLALAEKYLKSI